MKLYIKYTGRFPIIFPEKSMKEEQRDGKYSHQSQNIYINFAKLVKIRFK